MAGGGGGSSKSNAPKQRKRVEAETKDESTTNNSNSNTLLRARDGSAFARCEGCSKNVAVALISMHNCSLDAKIRVNLEAQVVETKAEAKKKKSAERKKSTSDEPKAKRVRKAKDEKKTSASNNKPKRPLTAFFIFMNDFRKTFKEENPSSSVKDVAKQGGEKWKSLTEEEKKVYLDKAAELKAEYNKSLESNDADEEEEDEEEKQSDDDDAEEKQADEADGCKENEDVNKESEGKEEEILDDY
ncbi:High mobility group B protein 7 [Raphanus sativus]|uniref:High mobility group B protein 7 n=1 Tax=Raphanus sativus TaxID=3726 RepID=A0A6J0KXN7_RAPSA|nr:high mobility group B protein 7 [Raphanus sativus]KAJ4872353.1 High mobility group B protein 7 [Raphanus sativus]